MLPHAGGKIPDSAFDTDRLALNRLQKEGIAVPDGVLLQQRNPQVFPYTQKSRRPVYMVKQFSDQRFTAAAGQRPDGATVETTYSLPQIANHVVVVPRDPIEPVLQQIDLPNALLQGGPLKLREKYVAALNLAQHQPTLLSHHHSNDLYPKSKHFFR